jgi:hypothetical protein
VQVTPESRWFWIPGIFSALLFAALALRWLPAALSKSHEPLGVGPVIVGDVILAWNCFLRCAVAYILTGIAVDWLPPIRWRTALVISVVALLGEALAEVITAQIAGNHAGVTVQLIATALAYSAVLGGSISAEEIAWSSTEEILHRPRVRDPLERTL